MHYYYSFRNYFTLESTSTQTFLSTKAGVCYFNNRNVICIRSGSASKYTQRETITWYLCHIFFFIESAVVHEKTELKIKLKCLFSHKILGSTPGFGIQTQNKSFVSWLMAQIYSKFNWNRLTSFWNILIANRLINRTQNIALLAKVYSIFSHCYIFKDVCSVICTQSQWVRQIILLWFVGDA